MFPKIMVIGAKAIAYFSNWLTISCCHISFRKIITNIVAVVWTDMQSWFRIGSTVQLWRGHDDRF